MASATYLVSQLYLQLLQKDFLQKEDVKCSRKLLEELILLDSVNGIALGGKKQILILSEAFFQFQRSSLLLTQAYNKIVDINY